MAVGHTINVSVLADTKKFSSAMRNLSKETGLDKLGNAFKTAGSKIVGFFKTGIKWSAAFLAGLGALAIKGGIDRMLGIEDAQAKLKGLGHDTKAVDAIMKNALASVRGTAFGLDEAAGLAATAVAAGIKPGEELERVLKLTADSATVAGSSLDEMGLIWGKVAAKGKVDGQTVNQMLQRQIPILTYLAEHYGVTAEEASKMVSQGKVSFEDFAAAMEANVAGAALESGNTTRGAFANMRAALSRVGAAFLTEIFPMFRQSFVGITGYLDNITTYAEKIGKAFGTWIRDTAVPAIQALLPVVQAWAAELRDRLVPAIEDMRTKWADEIQPALVEVGEYITGTVIPTIKEMTDWIREHKDELAAAAVTVGTFVASFVALNQSIAIIKAVQAAFLALNTVMLANPFVLVAAAIAALVAGLVYFFTQTETGQEIWERVWGKIQEVAGAVSDWFVEHVLPALQTAWEGIQAAAEAVSEWFTTTLVPALTEAWEAIKEAAGIAADWFMEHVWPVMQAAGDLIMAIWEQLVAAWDDTWNAIQAVWDTIGPPLMSAIESTITVLQGIWETVWDAIVIVLQVAWDLIRNAVETALSVIESVIRAVTAAIRGDWDEVWGHISDAAKRIWEGIKTQIDIVLNALWSIIKSVLGGIRASMAAVWNAIRDKASEAWNALKRLIGDKINEIRDQVKQLPQKAKDALGNLGSYLTSSGRALLQGFTDGIKQGFTRALDSVRNGMSNLRSYFPFSPAKKGPFSGRGYVTHSGKALVTDFAKAISAGQYTVALAANDLMAAASLDMAFQPPEATTRHHQASSPGQQPGWDDFGGERQRAPITERNIHVHNHYPVSEPVSVTTKRAMEYAAALGL